MMWLLAAAALFGPIVAVAMGAVLWYRSQQTSGEGRAALTAYEADHGPIVGTVGTIETQTRIAEFTLPDGAERRRLRVGGERTELWVVEGEASSEGWARVVEARELRHQEVPFVASGIGVRVEPTDPPS